LKRKKVLIITSAVVGALLLIGTAGVGAGVVMAKNLDSYPSIVQKLAQRFNLDPDEVKQVFDEERGERRQEAQDRFEESLDEAVKDGKITEAQKEAILEKHTEIQGEQEKLREELSDWAEENDIELKQLGPCGGRGFRGGLGNKHEEMLDEAVKDGKITEAQKEAILKKQDEIESKRKELKEDLEKWAEDNDIDLNLFFMFGRKGPQGGGFSPMP